MNKTEYYLGLMSGTSLDGVDAVLMRCSVTDFELCGHQYCHYPAKLKSDLLALRHDPSCTPQTIARLDQQLAYEYAAITHRLLANTAITREQITAIGCHGQTLWHAPEGSYGFSWQLGNATRLAALTGITVIHDFRSTDIALGGQGAPLAPAFHCAVFRSAAFKNSVLKEVIVQLAPERSVIVLNLGGFANITLLPSTAQTRNTEQTLISGDTGPANTLIDSWCRRHQDTDFDDQGAWGQSGQCHSALLEQLLAHPYFKQSFPKSTGFESFHLDWVKQQLAQLPTSVQPVDVQCTLHHLSAQSIAHAIQSQAQEGTLILCGGGVYNRFLVALVADYLGKNFEIRLSDEFGLPAMQVEAAVFAWLARQFIHGACGNISAATGARHNAVLGSLTPAPNKPSAW